MNRTRTSPLDAFGLRDQRNRIYPTMEGGDGSTLSLDFTTMTSLDSRFTFTRASTATFINSSGLVTTMAAASTNDPTKARFDYDPATLAPRGLLIEGSATNLLLNSSTFSGYNFVNSTLSASDTAPDGGSAQLLRENISATTTYQMTSGSRTVTSGSATTFSCFVKAATTPRRYLVFRVNDNSSNANAASLIFDTQTRTVSGAATAYGTWSAVSSQVTPFGSWDRVELRFTPAVATVNCKWELSDTNTRTADGQANSYTGGTTAGILVWGAQLETGSGASSYIPTGTSTVQRAADQMTMTNISALNFNQSGGTVFMQIDGNPKDVNTFPYFAAFEQSPSGRGWSFLRLNNSTSSGLRMLGIAFSIPTTNVLITSSNHTRPSGKFKFATTLEPAVCRMTYVIAGGSALVDTTTAGPFPTIGSLKFNNTTETSAADFGSVWISQFKYWPSVLPNATLQSLTQ